jgi:hypothetical protein
MRHHRRPQRPADFTRAPTDFKIEVLSLWCPVNLGKTKEIMVNANKLCHEVTLEPTPMSKGLSKANSRLTVQETFPLTES